jgi:hypothetical protein
VFSDEWRGCPPVPPPRYKRKHKLRVASVTTGTQHNERTDEAVTKIFPPKRRHQSASFLEVAVMTNDCYCKDGTSQDNNACGIVATEELTAKTVSDEADKSSDISRSVWVTDQPDYRSTNERQIYEVNNLCTRSEEYDQNDSGVYLPESVLSEESDKYDSLIQTENDFKSLGVQDTINSASKRLISLDPVMPVLDNSHKVSNECEKIAGALRNYTSCLSFTNEDSKHLLDEAQTCILCNTNLSEASTPTVGNSHILVENVEETSNDTINRICKCLKYEKSLKTENSHLCMDSNVQFSICGSDGTGSVFHKREQDLCNEALSQNKKAVQILLPKESVPTDVALVSSISFPLNQCHCKHANEENAYPRQSGLGLLSSNEEHSVSFIKYDTCTTEAKASSTDTSVVNDLTDAINRNNCTALARRIPKKTSICEGGCCSYSALDNFEDVSLNEEMQRVVSDSAEMVTKDHTYYKNNNCKTIARREEVHPNKISKNFNLFLKNMLTDDEEYDLNYQSDNTQGSIDFKCALNQTEVTNTTKKTSKRVACLELSKKEPAALPDHFKVSPRCIFVESCVVDDSVLNSSGYHNQHACGSEDCCVMSLSVDTTVPSSNENSQSPFHGEHQILINSDCSSNTKKSEEVTDYVSVGNKSTEDSANKSSEVIIETSKEESFVTVNKSATLPSSGSTDNINKSYNYYHDQIAVRSNVPDTVKGKNKPLKKIKINCDCLDDLKTEMDESSG